MTQRVERTVPEENNRVRMSVATEAHCHPHPDQPFHTPTPRPRPLLPRCSQDRAHDSSGLYGGFGSVNVSALAAKGASEAGGGGAGGGHLHRSLELLVALGDVAAAGKAFCRWVIVRKQDLNGNRRGQRLGSLCQPGSTSEWKQT